MANQQPPTEPNDLSRREFVTLSAPAWLRQPRRRPGRKPTP
jgi:hypothetical protein